jgi:tetraacyldisaccharide 4'-kinase
VISVGNLAMGGRGKTPLTAHVARLLIAAGERPAILSRGYGRREVEDGVTVVSDGAAIVADLDRSGDEPLMLARALPGAIVLVCDQRAIAAALAEHVFHASVLILDDGFQHRAVARDVDLVLVAEEDLRGRPMPFGRLREPVSALRRADALIADGEPEAMAALGHGGPTFRLERHLGPAFSLDPAQPLLSEVREVLAVAGIAQPERFFSALPGRGWQVAKTLAFPDHHHYTRQDIQRIVDAARAAGVTAMVTTAKDAVRLDAWRPLPLAVGVVPLEVAVEPAAEFRPWLFGRLAAARQAGLAVASRRRATAWP